MTQRVFGPIRGAGVQLTELAGENPIEPGALGITGYAGVLARGTPGELLGPFTSKSAMIRAVGSLISDSLLPDATQDFFDTAAGAGGLLLVRVTDGNEAPGGGYWLSDNATRVANLYSRRPARTIFGRISAKNGGRWGGKEKKYTAEFAAGGDLTEITLDTGLTIFATDEWKGGYIELDEVANTRYPIVSNTAAGVITVEADQSMASDLAASGDPTNFRYYLVIDDDPDIGLDVEIRDGDENPATEFGIFVSVDGTLIANYPDLSIDPNSGRYWVNVINDDGANQEIFAEDLFVGARTADVRPANYYGTSATLTATVLTRVLFDAVVNSPTSADPTTTLGTTDDEMVEQVITVTVLAGATTASVVSDRFGDITDGTPMTLGALFTPVIKWAPPMTVTNGGTALAEGDTVTISYKPFKPGELVGGFVFPDKANESRLRFRIASNDHDSLTAVAGSDLTNGTTIAAGAEFMIEFPERMVGGKDGVADLTDSDYINQAWDVDLSPFNGTFGRGLGLVKFATPGVTSTAVQKAGLAYAAAKNHQYRIEVPSNIVDESSVDQYVNETIGKNTYGVVSFPSYVYKADPNSTDGALKLVSATGMAHGREARFASDSFGFHRAAAGLTAVLPAVLKLPTGDTVLNEELLNPRGINVIKRVRGNFVLWGDRTMAAVSEWKFKHQRELMSYYEHVLLESFDFIIFGLNNAAGRNQVRSSMVSFFLPEYTKGALDNDVPFGDAARIKIDIENNTPATKAAGDMIAEISLKLVDVVERLRIFIGKQGVFEDVA